MGSDSKVEYKGIRLSNRSSRALFLRELNHLKEKLCLTPFPFCELDCPWLTICLEISTSECILSLLWDVNNEYYEEIEEERINRIHWS